MARKRKAQAERDVDRLIRLVRDREIRLVSLMHIGGDGNVKVLDFAPRDASHLRDILEGGERADGSSLFSGSGIKAKSSDMLLRPRLDRAFLDPFSEIPTLCVLCGHVGRDGAPLPESPDSILGKAYERLKGETGVDLHALGEVEFFLGHRASEVDMRVADEHGYHAAAPVVFGQAFRRKALTLLADLGVPIKYGHSEVGYVASTDLEGFIWEQHEIEMGLAPLPAAAEAVILTQWVLRNLAQQMGFRVTFDPILREGHAGSGLHFHFSPRLKGRGVVGRRPDGSMEEPAQWLIGGLVKNAGALMAFGNRNPGSFIRLRQGKEAPSFITWGQNNRKALIRIPTVAFTASGRAVSVPTIEFRLPDGSAHPYLLLAGVAQAMSAARSIPKIDELLRKTAASVRKEESQAQALPRSFGEVADRLEKQRSIFEADGVFPPHWIEMVLKSLRSER
ncbi:MAG: glutamine synthetase family protein [Pseudomonadota bacterium]